jgi:Uma2 family endonuclease
MAAPPDTKRGATYQDLERVPATMVAEIVDGELFASPRPAPRHTAAASALGADLHPPFQQGRGGPGGWWILDEPELHFGEDVLVPDLGGWTRDRLPSLPPEAFFMLAPDWVCEVISPHNERHDRVRKMPVYAREGVRHAWLVDPLERSLEVLRLEAGRWILLSTHRGDEIVRAEPFQAVEVDLLDLWGESRKSG